MHWLRAIELCQAQSGIADGAGVDLPRMYVRAIDALQLAGDSAGAATVAEEACRRFARHSNPVTAGVVCHRAAYWRAVESPAAGLALIEEALRLFGQAPPCAEQASAWCDYGAHFLYLFQDRLRDGEAALHRALQIAEAAGATTQIPDILARLAGLVFDLGQAEEGFAFLQRGWALAQASGNDHQLLWLAVIESDTLYKMGKFQGSAEVALRGLQAARQVGLAGSFRASLLAANAAEALIARGRTAEAAALIDPLTTGPPDRDHWAEHDFRAEIDLLRGDITGAAHRQQQNKACAGERADIIDHARGTAEQVVELALWAGRPGDAVEEAQRILAMFTTSDLAVHSGRLLIAGLRGCADLAEQARARRDGPAADAALAAADGLDAWVDQMAGVPFADHPLAATIPAHRATWAAEHTRLAGSSDPGAWANAAKLWQDLDCAHRAGYTWWRQAQAQLDAGQPPTAAAAALRAAAAAADGHVPLLAQVRALAERTRIPLRPPAPATPEMPAATAAPYGLTMRELAVLRLVAAGRSNAQIGAELYISRATASVHVTSILRKLGVTNRVQAAALAERAGLLDTPQS